VCLNFHRAPGYCINAALSGEPWNLWTDQKALDVFTFHWVHFARRYKGVPSNDLSFNLINEPNGCTMAQYARVVRHAAGAIREADGSRQIVVDGMFGETMLPVPELARVPNTVHSTRGYVPFSLTHYLAPWAGTPRELPTWPTRIGGAVIWDKDRLDQLCILPGQGLEHRASGTRMFVGEWGCWNRTPHDVTLAWMRDFLTLGRRHPGDGRYGASGARLGFSTATEPMCGTRTGAGTSSIGRCLSFCRNFDGPSPSGVPARCAR
jgi:endoglucanase